MARSSDILSLTGEAAVVARYGKIAFANASALGILGEGCLGKPVKAVFGKELASAQAAAFIAGLSLGGKNYIVRMSRMEEEQLIFLSCPELDPSLLNEPFLFFMRSTLMNMNVSVDRMRELAESAGNRDALSSVAVMTRSCYQLNRLIWNASMVLDLARGQLPLSCTELNLSQLCGKLVEQAAFFRPDIQFGGDLGQNICCPADASLVSQLLMNLLSNSLSHAKDCTRINVTLTDLGDGALLAVSDNGCGIGPERLHTVFNRYTHRFDLSTMNAGIGLGLTVARNVTQLHGGALLLESRPGSGTSVRASFYRRSTIADQLRSPSYDSVNYLRQTLIGLADCLPLSCFSENYMD